MFRPVEPRSAKPSAVLAAFVLLAAAGWAAVSLLFAGGEIAAERIELRYGAPTKDYVERTGYVAGRGGHFTPWVIEHLTADDFVRRAARDGLDFHVDEEQPAECRWTNGDYRGSGYDKGHLAPAADNVHSAAAMRDSFSLTNATPQTPELNRGPWRMLEEHVGRLAAGDGCEAWVVTGVAFLPNEKGAIVVNTIGPGGRQWVSTHCWKAVLLGGAGDGRLEAFAWLLPNTHEPPRYDACRVSVDDIERAVGLDLFADLDDELETRLEGAKP